MARSGFGSSSVDCGRLQAGRSPKPVDHQRLEQRREAGARIGPRNCDLAHPVRLALHARHLRDQKRPVLHRVQVSPPSLAGVVATARTIALRTAEPRTSRSNHEDPNLLIRMRNLDPGHLPRPVQADQLGVVRGDRVSRHPASISLTSAPLPSLLLACFSPVHPIPAPSGTHPKPGRALVLYGGLSRTGVSTVRSVHGACK